MDRSPQELQGLAERLRAGNPISAEDRERIATELEGLAKEPESGISSDEPPKRPLGRPARTPEERVLLRAKRAIISNDIYYGDLPPTLYHPDLALSVESAKGSRTEADEVAAQILGKGHSVRSIQQARERHFLHNQAAWEEFVALLLLRGRARQMK
jgi:hypothetical protein